MKIIAKDITSGYYEFPSLYGVCIRNDKVNVSKSSREVIETKCKIQFLCELLFGGLNLCQEIQWSNTFHSLDHLYEPPKQNKVMSP